MAPLRRALRLDGGKRRSSTRRGARLRGRQHSTTRQRVTHAHRRAFSDFAHGSSATTSGSYTGSCVTSKISRPALTAPWCRTRCESRPAKFAPAAASRGLLGRRGDRALVWRSHQLPSRASPSQPPGRRNGTWQPPRSRAAEPHFAAATTHKSVSRAGRASARRPATNELRLDRAPESSPFVHQTARVVPFLAAPYAVPR
jgi:hypothetical protein